VVWEGRGRETPPYPDRDPSAKQSLGPGSAMHRFTLHRIRDDRNGVPEGLLHCGHSRGEFVAGR
jgi:hypothetical protein